MTLRIEVHSSPVPDDMLASYTSTVSVMLTTNS